MIDQKFKPVELDKAQLKKWKETRTALVYKAPGFTHIFMTMMNPENDKQIICFTHDVPIAATDGSVMLANPGTFFKFDLMNRVFACGHEILHCVLNHVALMHKWRTAGSVLCTNGVKLPFDEDTGQIALDLVVNDMLVTSKIGKIYTGDPVTGEGGWYHWPHLVTQKDSATDAYAKIYKEKQGGGLPGKPKDGQGAPQPGQGTPVTGSGNQPPQQAPQPPEGSFDQHLKPGEAQGKNPTTAMAERSEARWDREIAAAMKIEQEAGQGSNATALLFKELLTPKVDWTDKVRALMSRKIGSDRWEWRKPDRRLIVRDIYAPSRSGYGCGVIVVGGDSSGSVVNERDMWLAEIAGMLSDMKPRQIIIVWCDDMVHDVDYCESYEDLNVIRRRGIKGAGGTSFVPVFDWIRDNQVEPDALIYLTDGIGRFPKHAPDFPVIWGSTVKKPEEYPWGDVVMVPRQKAKSSY